jgi:7,8-dihydroneopterin aldolase/epimerase/oxygenase
MGYIALEGLSFFAHHGYYDEEQILGSWFQVDIKVETDVYKSSVNDALEDTINYQSIFNIVEIQMEKSVKLIETLLYNIVDDIKQVFPNLESIEIKITKLNPPMGAVSGSSVVFEKIEFVNKCSKCGNKMVCYNDYNCWCKDIDVPSEKLSYFQDEYKGCLCRKCLES